MTFRCSVVAIGTELLLGQIVDTNSSWIGEQLALAGIDSHIQMKVGDNHDRMVDMLSVALDRSDAVIVCGGLGPTQDDITRDAIAQVMGVDLVRDVEVEDRIRAMFGSRGRDMPSNNLRQADLPEGAQALPVQPGTAPGLRCPVTVGGVEKVIYAVPGVPFEMKQMVGECVVPELAERAGVSAVIRSRTLKTWGWSESGLAERLGPRIEELDAAGHATIAFLASGIEGLKVRITAKASSEDEVQQVLDAEEAVIRPLIDEIIFGVDDDTMESVVLDLCRQQGLTLAAAESLTGGLIGKRITDVPGASDVFRGSVVSYASEVKREVLGVGPGPVVSEDAACAMALGACRVLGADVAVAATGVAGPDPQEGQQPGTVWLATAVAGDVESTMVRLPGDRNQIRQFSVISVLNLLRLRLQR